MAGNRIGDAEQLDAWLANKEPRWGQAIAARVALRMLPFVSTGERSRYAEDLVLTVFRSSYLVWAALKYPHAISASTVLIDGAISYDTARHGADIAAYAGATSADTAATIWESVGADALFLDEMLARSTGRDRAGASPEVRAAQRLIEEPLWLIQLGTPGWALVAFKRLTLDTKLRMAGFDVWFDWYRALLPFEPLARPESFFGVDIDLRLTRQQKAWWARPVVEVNGEIKAWLARVHRTDSTSDPGFIPPDVSPPSQDPLAIVMAVNADGKVDTASIDDQTRLLDTPEQRSDYADVISDARDLHGLGDNLLGKLAAELDELLAVMPEDFSQATIRPVWRAGNRLRRTYNAHRAVADVEEPHFAKLDPAVAVELESLLATLNNFFFTDPGLRARDERRIPPQDRVAAEKERARIAPVVADALDDKDISTHRARGEVRQEDENARTAGNDQHGAQALDQANRTVRNFIAAAISGAFQAGKKIVAACGREAGVAWSNFRQGVYVAASGAVFTDIVGLTAVYRPLIDFVIRQAETLKMYVIQAYQNPAVQQIIDWLVRVFG